MEKKKIIITVEVDYKSPAFKKSRSRKMDFFVDEVTQALGSIAESRYGFTIKFKTCSGSTYRGSKFSAVIKNK